MAQKEAGFSAATKRRKLWVDTDAGLDDCVALLMALKAEDVDIVGVSSVFGNSKIDTATDNVLKLVTQFHEGDKRVPIYPGAGQPILGGKPIYEQFPWEGNAPNGLGGYEFPASSEEKRARPSAVVFPIPAALAIQQTCERFPGEVELVCLGPLTNIALAIRLSGNPDLLSQFKSVTVMGGALQEGNTTATAEYNFLADPEAAKIVLDNCSEADLRLVSWETTAAFALEWAELESKEGRVAECVQGMFAKYRKIAKGGPMIICDAVAMHFALAGVDGAHVKERRCTVECSGKSTRGQLVVQWEPLYTQWPEDQGGSKIKLVNLTPKGPKPPSQLVQAYAQGVWKTMI